MNKTTVTKNALITSSIATAVIGIIFIIFPNSVIDLISYIVGGGLLFVGMLSVYSYFKHDDSKEYSFGFAIGVILAIFGIYLIVKTSFLLSILSVFFGFFIIINGIFELQFAIDSLRAKKNSWKIKLLIAIINIVLGIIILYNPFVATEKLIMYIGIFMVITAALNMIMILIGKKESKKINTETIVHNQNM